MGKGASSRRAHARLSRHADSRVGTLRLAHPTRSPHQSRSSTPSAANARSHSRAGLRDLDNSLRDDFLDDVGLPQVVERLAGTLERLAHSAGGVGIEGAVLEKPQAIGHRSTSPVDSATVALGAVLLSVRGNLSLIRN